MDDDLDMPQILSKVTPKGDIYFSAGTLYQSPFAKEVAYVIALWSHIDGDIATILSKMLKSDIVVGTAMYMALTSAEAKKAALNAAASQALPEWQSILLQAVIRVTKPVRDERNAFAHHAWGICTEFDDRLLLTHPKTILAVNVSHRQRSQELPDGRGVIAPRTIDRSEIKVYGESDFKRVVSASRNASEFFTLFYATLSARSLDGARTQLLNEPQIQQALRKLTHESDPQVQAILHPKG